MRQRDATLRSNNRELLEIILEDGADRVRACKWFDNQREEGGEINEDAKEKLRYDYARATRSAEDCRRYAIDERTAIIEVRAHYHSPQMIDRLIAYMLTLYIPMWWAFERFWLREAALFERVAKEYQVHAERELI